MCVDVGGLPSWGLEEGCCSGSHGSKQCTPGSLSQPSQLDMGLNLVVLDLEEHTEQDHDV